MKPYKRNKKLLNYLAALIAIVFVFTIFAPVAFAAEGDTGTTAEGFEWRELPGNEIEITGYSGAGGAISVPQDVSGVPVTSIAAGAFNSQSSIISVDIPASVTSIGEDAFSICANLSGVTLRDGLETIGISAFRSSGLTSVDIPASVTSIGGSAFAQCASLSGVTLHDGLEYIGITAFMDTALTSVDIPASVIFIDKGAFIGCASLSGVTLHDGLETIDMAAFSNTALSSVYVPASVTSIGDSAFLQCAAMTRAVIFSRTATFGTNVFEDTAIGTDGIYGFAGSSAQTYATDNSIPFHFIFTVSYETDGGTSMGDSLVLSGETPSDPSDPVRSGYVFGGWYLDSAFAQPVTFPLSVQGDITLFAKWTELFTVSYETYGGTSIENSVVLSGNTLSAPSDPVRSGYVFGGWYLDTALSQPVTFPMAVTQDVTIYAKWTELILNLSATNGHINTGGRVTITPSVAGGVWSFDGNMLSRDGNSFTGLKAGTVRVTYTVGQQSVYVDIVITASQLPVTGQDFTAALALGAAGLLAALAALIFLKINRVRKRA